MTNPFTSVNETSVFTAHEFTSTTQLFASVAQLDDEEEDVNPEPEVQSEDGLAEIELPGGDGKVHGVKNPA